MPIIATPKGTDRNPAAKVVCDICGHTEIVRADYEKLAHGGFKLNEGQVTQKLNRSSWSIIKKVVRCPDCEAKRRVPRDDHTPTPEEEIMPTDNVVAITPVAEEPRKPSREQKRQIVTLLTEVYDTKTGRYTGTETDKTVAETIGNGVMFGWVAQIREDLFGPDGGNEELEALEMELAKCRDEAALFAKTCHENIQNALASLRDFNRMRGQMDSLVARVEALKTAIGPRARNA